MPSFRTPPPVQRRSIAKREMTQTTLPFASKKCTRSAKMTAPDTDQRSRASRDPSSMSPDDLAWVGVCGIFETPRALQSQRSATDAGCVVGGDGVIRPTRSLSPMNADDLQWAEQLVDSLGSEEHIVHGCRERS